MSMIMITWILLVSLFSKSTQSGNGQQAGLWQCEPQNLVLDRNDEMLILNWEDDPSCSALHDVPIYEIVVLREDKQVHHEVPMNHNQSGSSHSWKWKSSLPLECASHSVRLRFRYNNYTSPWTQEQTLPGSTRYRVYPRDRVFEAGSTATFCCIVPAGETFSRMNYNHTEMSTVKISNQTYALTLTLDRASDSCIDVHCITNQTSKGACVYVSYLPDDTDLQCETRDFKSVECFWKVGRSHLPHRYQTVYQLLGRYNIIILGTTTGLRVGTKGSEAPVCLCEDGLNGKCSKKIRVDPGERNWTLSVQNKLGKLELHYTADLTERVHMLPPYVNVSSVNARNISLEWMWNVLQYNNINITCQVNISDGETSTIKDNYGTGLNFIVITDLTPHWTYNVRVRCRTSQNFSEWSEWSHEVTNNTNVPDAPDVWMQMRENRTVILWKPLLDKQSHGNIIDYQVAWAKTSEQHQQNQTVPHSQHSLALNLDTQKEHIVTVTARNIYGRSPTSVVNIPSLGPDRTRVNTSGITGSNSSFSLSWSASMKATCGYVVDWCPFGHGTVEWLKVPPNKTNARISSENFKDGIRYLLSIYACTERAPVLLERFEGYVKEKRIKDELFKSLKFKQQDSNVEVNWDPIPLKEQTAFIRGYTLYALDKNSPVFSVSTDNPEATSLTATNLKITSYTFTVTAQTTFGKSGNTSIIVTLNSQTDNLIKSVFISLGAVFGLLSLITILCYRHWACITQKIYPPIPTPVLKDKWLTSSGGQLLMDQSFHSEADVMDVPELHYKSGGALISYASREDMSFAFPKGYYNKDLKMCTQPPLTLPTTALKSQSGLPTSPFRGLFTNPSYDLIMQTRNQQTNSGLEVQEETPTLRCSSGYKPQSQSNPDILNQIEADSDSPMFCVTTYILLPQPSST
ncbi:leukemia inhibitory factor receptor-like isoform X2 [Mugil cephalus]|uniref:leukemia inhibitory factor receptor-like isoform X2 n=1 Tax=Mugil cephalus TaxID=48193 RepID=UPI001FB61EB3|nr:leukemia inhibitory factor receptor-like isoform X2 [Mugil cephalus]